MWVGVCVVLSLLPLLLHLRFLLLLLLLHLPSLHLFFLSLFLLRFFPLLPLSLLLVLQHKGPRSPSLKIADKVVELLLLCSGLLFSFLSSKYCRPQSCLEGPHHLSRPSRI